MATLSSPSSWWMGCAGVPSWSRAGTHRSLSVLATATAAETAVFRRARPRIPVLGPLHRPRWRPRHPGPPDAGPRPRRGPHRPAQRLRPVAVPLHRLRRQRGVASCRVLGSGPGPAGSSCSVSPGPSPGRCPNGCAGNCGTHPPASFVKPEATSSASSTDGPTPPTSSPPTDTSPPSPDRRPAPIPNAGRGTATPPRPPNQPPGTTRPSTHPEQPANATPQPKTIHRHRPTRRPVNDQG